MAVTKARSADPVRNLYVTTVHMGRVVKKAGEFGKHRLGGLPNAQVDGASTSTGATRLATPKAEAK